MLTSDNKLIISDGAKRDLINIITGAYSPLSGFLYSRDLDSVARKMRLGSGEIWSLPIVLSVTAPDYQRLRSAANITLTDQAGNILAFLYDPEFYLYDKDFFCRQVFLTNDLAHPSVTNMMSFGEYFLGGRVTSHPGFNSKIHPYHLTPEEVKAEKLRRGWRTMVAFQTRNIPHRSHEFLQGEALKVADGLLVQPVIGKKKTGDFSDDLIIAAYEFFFRHYHDPSRTMLSVLPLEMRYAGPREAVHHALVRKNHGVTHFIVGRDHAGVGNYYGPFAAQEIFNQFDPAELGIEILKYDNAHYCPDCADIVFSTNHHHESDPAYVVSGTRLREMVKNHEILPEFIVRPEVAELVRNHPSPLVE